MIIGYNCKKKGNQMGNRISKVYTKTGDDGTTGLGNGKRVPKTHSRVKSFGKIDSLNSQIGLAISFIHQEQSLVDKHRDELREIQHRLFDIGGELSIPDFYIIDEFDVKNIENLIDYHNEDLKPLKNFILPGGSIAASQIHICRTLAREAEIQLIECQNEEKNVNEHALKYLNRLSDLFFVLARQILFNEKKSEILWEQKK